MAKEVIIDNFLNDFDGLRKYCDHIDYSGLDNPEDGVFYDGVSIDIPEAVIEEVVRELNNIHNREINLNYIFLRLSTSDMQAPHQAHTDSVMGSFSLMLYLNRVEDCIGGTSLVIHKKTGLCENPVNDKQAEIWEKDCNNPDAWSILSMCPMIPNRAFIFDASLMHRAEPIGGFGDNAKNGRLVLTAFYD